MEDNNSAVADEPGRWYWLARCEGCSVTSPEGRLGVVDDVLATKAGDSPRVLVLRVGIVRQRLVEVPIEAVTGVFPRQRQIVLNSEMFSSREGARTRPPAPATLKKGGQV